MLPAMLPWLTAGMGLLVSPDHLRIWGNLAGHIGPGFWMVALGAMAVYAPTVTSYRRLVPSVSDSGGYLAALQAQGGFAAVALALTSRLVLTIGVSIGVLVTAGFVFNETFVYWFPNFAFAFIYLSVIALVLCLEYGLAEKAQSVLLGITLLGLVILVVSGFLQPGPQPAPDALPSSGVGLRAVSTGLLLFVGFDLGIHRVEQARDTGTGTRMMFVVLMIIMVLLSLLGTVFLEHVPAKRLAGAFMPYTVAARTIGGQPGRILMGIVVIAGAGCAVISLFAATARMVTSLVQLEMLPGFCRGSARRGVLTISVMTFAVAAMLAAGFAGSPNLEVFIRAGFLLWLLHVIMVHLAAANTHDPKAATGRIAWLHYTAWLSIPAATLMSAAAMYLWITDSERMLLSTYMLAAWFGGAAVLFLVHVVKLRRKPPAD